MTAGLLLSGCWALAALAGIGVTVWPKLPDVAAAFRGPFEPSAYFFRFWFGNALATLWLAAVVLTSWWSGRCALRVLGRPRGLLARERPAIGLVTGLGICAYAAMAAGLLGLWQPVVCFAFTVGPALAAIPRLARARRPATAATAPSEARWLRAAAVAIGGLAAVFCLTPETWMDSLFYHLNAPADFADLHKWVDVDEAVYRYPLLAEALFGPALAVAGEQAATLVNDAAAGLACWVLWLAAARLGGAAAGWTAVLALVSSDQVGFHLGQTNQGFFSMTFAFTGVWAWTASARRPSARWMMLAGAFLAWAVCAKYTAAAPLAGVAAWELLRFPRDPSRRAGPLAAFAFGFAAGGGGFFGNDWLWTRNPVYPLVFGGLNWGAENDRLLRDYGCPGTDFRLGDPASVGRAVLGFLTWQQPLALLGLPAIAALPWRALAPFACAWGGAVLALAAAAPCFRFMFPAYPALALLTGAGLARWVGRRDATGRVARAAVLSAALGGAVHAVVAADFHKRSFNAAIGLETEDAYMRRVLTSYWTAVREVNARVPFLARLMAVGEGRGYRFAPLVFNRGPEDVPQVLDLVREARDPGTIGKRLRERGVTWLLLNFVSEEYQATFWRKEFRWRPEEVRRWWAYWRTHGRVVWTSPDADGVNGGYVLYRVEPAGFAPPAAMPYLPGAAQIALGDADEDPVRRADRLATVVAFAPGVAFFIERRVMALLNARGDPARVLRELDGVMGAGSPEQAELFGLRGVALSRLRRFREAAAAFARAARLKPGDPAYARYRDDAARRASGR